MQDLKTEKEQNEKIRIEREELDRKQIALDVEKTRLKKERAEKEIEYKKLKQEQEILRQEKIKLKDEKILNLGVTLDETGINYVAPFFNGFKLYREAVLNAADEEFSRIYYNMLEAKLTWHEMNKSLNDTIKEGYKNDVTNS
jgi:hypothetical protein